MPLTDLYWSVDEAGAWGGAGAGRFPASAASLGYGAALKGELSAPGAGVILTSLTLIEEGGATNFTLTAALVDTNVFGFLNQNPFITGAISPDEFNGQEIGALYVDTGANPTFNGTYLGFFGALAADFFTTLVLNGVTLSAASAAFSSNSGVMAAPNSFWFWAGENPISGTGTFAGSLE